MKPQSIHLPKIHFACSEDNLRKVMNHVLVTKENVVATNAHIIVIHKTDYLFSQEFINDMPDRFLIHRKLWSEMCKDGIKAITFDKVKQVVVLHCDGYKRYVNIELEENLTQEFPLWESVIPQREDAVPVNYIGISLHLVSLLEKTLFRPNEYPKCKFVFYDTYRSIKVIPDNHSGSIAILMPILIQE